MLAITIKRKITDMQLGVGLIWLFQISAIIGITLGYQQWFVTKTPLNLVLLAVLVSIHLPVNTVKKALLGVGLFMAGMFVEWIGVHYDWLFGPYYYGDNLGWKFDGVPYMIGINWMVLVFVTAGIVQDIFNSKWIRILVGALLMIFLDFFIEVSAPKFDFWYFDNHIAPLQNYIAWFIISLVLHALVQLSEVRLNRNFAVQVYLAQLVFFLYFFVFHAL